MFKKCSYSTETSTEINETLKKKKTTQNNKYVWTMNVILYSLDLNNPRLIDMTINHLI